ncbi:tetratricopeptide repeat protein [Psychrobacillus psychrodurans]|uniref:Tetratricopeptide repeat-containing protein n=1 Tax=Psychrobacillus psychrodurans TaxID=126157 RepID=A0A9X3R9C3_9BACI|nr:hypothetical protein [Psychrobacillus psychrodurans]MCZ8532023.1 hypothetical protein [Psychrobacillus psychrodurans]
MKKQSLTKKSEKNIFWKYIFFFILIISIVVLILMINYSTKQDEVLLNDYVLLDQLSKREFSENKEDVIDQYETLLKKYPRTYMITYQLGYAYLEADMIKPAVKMYARALDLNPYLVENPDFMYQYSVALINNEEAENAKNVIERAIHLSVEEEYQARLTNLLEIIERK